MSRVLILTAGYGEGHNAAARAAAAALSAQGAEVDVRDFFMESYGDRQLLSQRFYIDCINRAPALWALVYHLLDRLPLMRLGVAPFLFTLRRRLAAVLAETQPRTVLSVYPAYGYVLDQLYRGRPRPFRLSTLVTDSITINSIWHRCGSDEWIVANDASAAVMKTAGVAAEKILPLGFPVPPVFTDARPFRPDPGPLRVLYMVNHNPELAPAIVRALLGNPRVELTVTTGHNETLARQIRRAAQRPLEILGWSERIPELLMRAHLFIGKAGGASTQETIAANTPMIITKAVPGQEEGNARLLIEGGCGALCRTPREIAEQISTLTANDAALWKQWAAAIRRIARPDAARAIATHLLRP